MAASSLLRDRIAAGAGAADDLLLNPDLARPDEGSLARTTATLAAMERARADLADDVNLNARLLVERALLSAGSGP